MGFVWESYFECVECGTTDKSVAVDYDRLGYSICPICGGSNSPLTGNV